MLRWEKDNETPDFNVENLRRDKKPWLTTDWKHPLWRMKTKCKVLPNSSQPILRGPLEWYLLLSASHLLLSEHTWSPHQTRSRLLLESTQEENEFLHKTKRMRYECYKNQPMFIFKKSIKTKFLGKLGWDFLGASNLKEKREWGAQKRMLQSFYFQKWEKFDFKWEWSP